MHTNMEPGGWQAGKRCRKWVSRQAHCESPRGKALHKRKVSLSEGATAMNMHASGRSWEHRKQGLWNKREARADW